MKKDIIRIDYNGNEDQNGHWWKWNEYCDKCGTVIGDYSQMMSKRPNMDEADFCVPCIQELMDLGIPYEDAKKRYKK